MRRTEYGILWSWGKAAVGIGGQSTTSHSRKKLAPSLLQADPCSICCNPIAVTQDRAATPLGHKAIVVWVERFGRDLCLLVLIRWPICGERRQQQTHVLPR